MEALIYQVVFYVFAALTVLSALAVVSAKNSVHSVLFLILCFFTTAALFILLGAEYIAMTLVIVYVGAVAVLFLFVVMMLNVNFSALREGFAKYLPFGAGLAILLFGELFVAMRASKWKSAAVVEPVAVDPAAVPVPEVSNIQAIGNILYTDYVYVFQLAGLILLVAMVGAIVLTLRDKGEHVRRQNIGRQVARRREDAVEVVKVPTGGGMSHV